MKAVSASRRLRSARFGLRSAALNSFEMAPTTSPRSRVRRAAVLDRRGDLLVGRVGGFGEVMASPLGLISEQFGQTLVGRAPLVVRRVLDHHRLENRVPEPQLADAVVDHDEMVAFGRPEFLESSGAARCRQHPEVAGSVQRGEQEQATRRLREPLDPRLVQRSQLPARSRGRRGVVAVALAAGRSRRTPTGPADCLAPPRRRRRRRRVGRWTNRRVSNSIASASGSGATTNSGNPVRSKNPPTPGRIAPSSPIRLPRNRRPTNPTTAPLARSSHCRSSTTMSSGVARRRLTEQRQRCGQHREAVRCRAGTDAERNLERHATRSVGCAADRRTADRRAGGGRRS